MLELKPEGLADAVSQAVAVCGRQLIADNSGALYWPSQRTLLVADLSLENVPTGSRDANGAASAAPSAARQTLVKLADVMDRYEPARVVVLGGRGAGVAAGMTPEELEILSILQEDREWVWLTGRADTEIAPGLGGGAARELEMSGIVLRHRPTPGWATHEVAGGMRPAARFAMYGYAIRCACFVGNGQRLVMPAFGISTEGLNVLDDAFRPLFPNRRHGGLD